MTQDEVADVGAFSDRYDALQGVTDTAAKKALATQMFAYVRTHPDLDPWAVDQLQAGASQLGGEDVRDPGITHYDLEGPNALQGTLVEDQLPIVAGLEAYWKDTKKFDASGLDDLAKKINPLGNFGGVKTLAAIVVVGIIIITVGYAFYSGLLKRATRAGSGGR